MRSAAKPPSWGSSLEVPQHRRPRRPQTRRARPPGTCRLLGYRVRLLDRPMAEQPQSGKRDDRPDKGGVLACASWSRSGATRSHRRRKCPSHRRDALWPMHRRWPHRAGSTPLASRSTQVAWGGVAGSSHGREGEDKVGRGARSYARSSVRKRSLPARRGRDPRQASAVRARATFDGPHAPRRHYPVSCGVRARTPSCEL